MTSMVYVQGLENLFYLNVFFIGLMGQFASFRDIVILADF